ncbi:histidine kinase [Salipiger aestuarii]|uniref:HPt (Histidine-containing phosphotransfer) domain-containing protein n=1 Tax=Salipiger aestuarii TaxID=568098 RepID=A0A327YKI1_9RHOB|nr:Hpt domain-containing protein [Salipiger aestuarii]EIE50083.1 Hpt domain-containing protein [Citreicella sp. 357]KAA8609873.1 histidine kinase [Salipiger aestuarii]KAA8616185.1 histidine kinase [Salipiger aestuarii]KAB2543132.1 histidine kinase [Salipiger aestuarii]RAK21450.1 HPt (histidine-containing phosphotransfer) domain-containing protein [Salipiger aestuarii]
MIDWDRVAELRDEIGAEDFDDIVDAFLTEVEGTLEELPQAAGSAPDIESKLHYLKGSALNLGFSALATLCQTWESAAKRGQIDDIDLARVSTIYRSSRDEFLRELPKRYAA